MGPQTTSSDICCYRLSAIKCLFVFINIAMNPLAYVRAGASTGSYSLYGLGRWYTISGAHELTLGKARRLLERNPVTHVIDVRSDSEWTHGHYTNAKHIPVGMITEHNLKRLNIKKDSTVLIYCATGHRARNAGELLKSLGYRNVFYITFPYTSLTITPPPSPSSSSERYASPPTLVATA